MGNIKKAEFVGSYVKTDKCPTDGKPEYAFIGRSNVGKSSLINMLCQQKDLAKTSRTPGKTQTMNFFRINESWYIVDMPGYGYARTSKTMREAWEKMIWYYLTKRETLQYIFVLIDAMVPPQPIDLDFINKLGEKGIPFVIVFTKTDRLKAEDRKRNIENFNKKMLENWETLPPQYITSSERKLGRMEILSFIEQANLGF
ncbi:MAG: YihA family ribosome biogenesis GTP-binding protein [Saprospiraceae bacterium]|nr:YihA family ribosome biogenesis GTP-binding protein [Saprospiraceae bacterium]